MDKREKERESKRQRGAGTGNGALTAGTRKRMKGKKREGSIREKVEMTVMGPRSRESLKRKGGGGGSGGGG